MRYFTIAMILAGVMLADQVTVTYDSDEQMLVKPEDIPVSIQTDVSVPTVDVPSVDVPTVDVPEPDVPEVTIPSTKAVYMVEKAIDSCPTTGYVIALSGTTSTLGDTLTFRGNITNDDKLSPSSQTVSYYVPKSLSSLNIASYYVPASSTGTITTYYVPRSVSRTNVSFYYVPKSLGSLNIASYYVPQSADPTNIGAYYVPETVSVIDLADISTSKVSAIDYEVGTELTEFANEVKDLFLTVRDRRSFKRDPVSTDVNGHIAKWNKIYATFTDYTPDYVPLPGGIRMIAEARVPDTSDGWGILKQNLSYYKKEGYNSVLITFTDEDPEIIRLLASFVDEAGMDIYFAYSGGEHLNIPVFRDPVRLRQQITTIAPMSKGMLLAWRRTSAHLFLQDAQFTNFIMKCARDANKNIAIIGEGYYGATAESDLRHDYLTYTMPTNVSGCALVGVGMNNINVKHVVNDLFADVDVPKIAVILGPNAYYETRNRTKASQQEIANVKKRLERRFLNAGCAGTITLHGDGSDGIYNQSYTDNISTSLINN